MRNAVLSAYTLMRSTPGPDDVTYSALANLGPRGQNQLLDFFNNSWETGQVPSVWKNGRIIPILKPGKSPYDIASYRPIALSSCIGKLMEKMVNYRLEWYLENTDQYPDVMSGFRRGRSSLDNVIDLVTFVEQDKKQR